MLIDRIIEQSKRSTQVWTPRDSMNPQNQTSLYRQPLGFYYEARKTDQVGDGEMLTKYGVLDEFLARQYKGLSMRPLEINTESGVRIATISFERHIDYPYSSVLDSLEDLLNKANERIALAYSFPLIPAYPRDAVSSVVQLSRNLKVAA